MQIKKRKELPSRKITTALLADEVGANWNLHFPNFHLNNVNAANLQADAAQLKTYLKETNHNQNNLKQNTANLFTLNATISNAINILKSHIKIACWSVQNPKIEYAQYGLLLRNRSYELPADNDLRQVALQTLVKKLQEINNPIANAAQGLNFWLDLQTRHAQLWHNSRHLRADKSSLAQQTDVLADKILLDLKRVRKGLEIEYTGTELARQKRVMGFLKESL